MYDLDEIESRSACNDEILVEYIDALELLDIFEKNDTKVLGWEGWIKYSSGSLGHSQKYRETTDLSAMPNSSAIALAKSKIMQAHIGWEEIPEVENASLLFCIITNT